MLMRCTLCARGYAVRSGLCHYCLWDGAEGPGVEAPVRTADDDHEAMILDMLGLTAADVTDSEDDL